MKKVVVGILIVAAIATLVILNINKNNDSTGTSAFYSGKAVSVKVNVIGRGSINSYVKARGKVEEADKAQVFFDTPLRVLEVLVDKNDYVNKGDRLIQLDTQSLTEEIDKLKMQKEIQSINLKKLESGQSLLSLETSLTSARKAADNARDSYDTAVSEFEKQKKLFETGIIPKTQLDQYERAMKEAKTVYENALLNLESAEKTYQSGISSHDLDIQTQIKNIELLSLQISDIEKKLIKIENLEKAPISGYVTEIYVTEGSYIGSGQPAFTIIDAENVRITAAVNEYNIKDLAVGQEVVITGEAFGDNTKISGKIISVAPVATVVPGLSGQETVVEVSIEPLDGKDLLKPGLNVDCEIITQKKDNIIVSEFNVFLEDKNRNQYAMVVDEETMTVRKQYVTLGIYSDMLVEIVDGLKEGDKVVIDPQPSLEDGDRVRIVE